MNNLTIEIEQERLINPIKTSGSNKSFWIEKTEPLLYSKLKEDQNCDTVVVGGGISGILTAYLLSKENKKVIVVEDGQIGSGETGRTTAHLSTVLEERYYHLFNYFNEKNVILAAESHKKAVELIHSICKEENIDCDFEWVDGFLFLHPSDEPESLQKEFEAAKKAGVKCEIVQSIPGINIPGPYLKFPKQAQFHPQKFLSALCRIIENSKGKIFTNTHAEEISKKGIKTDNGFFITAENIVVATNSPVNDIFKMHTKQSAYRSYVIGAKIKKGIMQKALWWDTGNQLSEWSIAPYHYIRMHPFDDEYDLLIIGGEDHKTGQEKKNGHESSERYYALEEWMIRNFQLTGDIIYKWSGQVLEPIDSLAFIGRNPGDENIFIITGQSGNGMTYAAIGAELISDLIHGRKNKYKELYDPSRKNLKAAGTFLHEQANVISQLKDILTKGDIDSINELKVNDGAVIRDDNKKIAVYKDENGKVHTYSAVCPHLKCIVQWNSDEKTFDCPCHGSRFTPLGKVINGPANKDLTKVKVNLKS